MGPFDCKGLIYLEKWYLVLKTKIRNELKDLIKMGKPFKNIKLLWSAPPFGKTQK